jgi:hypothetical protein
MWADPLSWYPWIKVFAFIVGVFAGGCAFSSTSWVWLKKQILTNQSFGLQFWEL